MFIFVTTGGVSSVTSNTRGDPLPGYTWVVPTSLSAERSYHKIKVKKGGYSKQGYIKVASVALWRQPISKFGSHFLAGAKAQSRAPTAFLSKSI